MGLENIASQCQSTSESPRENHQVQTDFRPISRVQSLAWEDLCRRARDSLQYSCLEKPMDRGAWQASVHRVTKSRIRLSD